MNRKIYNESNQVFYKYLIINHSHACVAALKFENIRYNFVVM